MKDSSLRVIILYVSIGICSLGVGIMEGLGAALVVFGAASGIACLFLIEEG